MQQLQMANKDLINLVELLNFQNPSSIYQAQKTLMQDKKAYIQLLAQLLSTTELPSISHHRLQQAKMCSSIALNYLFKTGIEDMQGIEQLQLYWHILFNWQIQLPYKINLEQSFICVLQFWQSDHEMMFQQGVSTMTKCLIQYANQQGLQEITKIVKLKGGQEFFVSFHHQQSIHKVIASLIFVCKACLSTLTNKREKSKYFKFITGIIVNLFKIIRRLKNDCSTIKLKLQLIDWALQCCEQMESSQQGQVIIQQFFISLRFDQMMLDVFRQGGSPQNNNKSLSWIRTDGQQQWLKLKIMAADTYIKFTHQVSSQANMQFFLDKEQNIAALLSTVSTYLCSQKQSQNHLEAQFISCLLQTYIGYFTKLPNIFQIFYKINLQLYVLPLLKIDQDYFRRFEHDASRCLNQLNDYWLQQSQKTTFTKAIKIVRYIANQSNEFYNHIISMVISLLTNNNIGQYFEIRPELQPSIQSSWLILIAISPLLLQDQQNTQKVINIIEGAQIMLSDLELALATFFLKTILTKSSKYDIVKSLFNNFLVQGLNRKNTFLQELMIEMKIQNIQDAFSWDFFQFIFLKLLMGKQDAKHTYWIFLQKSLKFHLKQFHINQLQTILTSFYRILLAQSALKVMKDRTYIVKILQLVKIVISNCQLSRLTALSHIIIGFFRKYHQVKRLNFGCQMLHLIDLFFKKQQRYSEIHDQVLQIAIGAYNESSQNHESCIKIFNRCIWLNRDSQSNVWRIILQVLLKKLAQFNHNEQDIQYLYIDLLAIQYILHVVSLEQHLLQPTIQILIDISSQIQHSIIQIRIMNIMLAIRAQFAAKSFDWLFVKQIFKLNRLSDHERRLTLHNIRRLIDNSNERRSWQDYANILGILYYSHQSNIPEQSKTCLDAKISEIFPFQLINKDLSLQVQQLFKDIIKRKFFVYHFIEEKLPNEIANYFNSLLVRIMI